MRHRGPRKMGERPAATRRLGLDGHGRVVPGPVRGYAGDYLQTELLVELLGPLPAAMLSAGMLVGVAVGVWAGADFGLPVATATLLVSLAWWWWRRRRRSDLLKGHVAERQIGRALEEAVTAKGCAVAHNVTALMDSGDVDHIVATPQSVWVIETKYRRVPGNRFPKVLSRLHACRARVEAVLPPGTPVRACLVLAYEEDGVQAERDGVRVYNNDRFRRELLRDLKAERIGPVEVDEQVSGVVWRLSRGEGVPDFPRTSGPPTPPGQRRSADSDAPPAGGTSRRFPNAYKPWTREEDDELLRLREAGWHPRSLAGRFGRRQSAIKSRLRKLRQD